jgi:hypothetical protein
MASLTAHLRRPEDHGRLAFHPECPICRRERVSGAPPADAIVGPRNQALLAASVLALSTASPTAALAAGPDQEKEGTAAPELVVGDQAQPAPAFDPGGQSTELPVDVAPDPAVTVGPDATGETAPLEQEPATDELALVEDAGTPGVEEQQAPPSPEPLPAAPPVEPVAAEPRPVPPVPEAPAPTDQEPQVQPSPPSQTRERPIRTTEPDGAPPPMTAPAVVPSEPEPVAVPVVASSTTTVRTALGSATRVRKADRFHVVQRGESLWSIARDLLGDDASVARIAREVNRLWELNSERIGTGEPDLVIAGTRIVLR